MNFAFSEETLAKLPDGDIDKHPVGRAQEIAEAVAHLYALDPLSETLTALAAGFCLGYQMRMYDEKTGESIPTEEIMASILSSWAGIFLEEK